EVARSVARSTAAPHGRGQVDDGTLSGADGQAVEFADVMREHVVELMDDDPGDAVVVAVPHRERERVARDVHVVEPAEQEARLVTDDAATDGQVTRPEVLRPSR
ncbi:MAG TPA: hypothetical protein VE575_05415, partial [Acidimicrobiales bacterium]|nr:hypothetical protein [Acidimicrobiales bacterium]